MKSFLEFLGSIWGLGAMGVVALLLVAAAFSSCGSRPSALPAHTNSTQFSRYDLDPGSIPSHRQPQPTPSVRATNSPKPSVVLSIDSPLSASTQLRKGSFAPAGAELFCELVNTLESINMDTPIIARVVQDLWYDGSLIVPAGTKVLGKAKVDRVRDRIAGEGTYTLVFPSGEELKVEGMALHRDEIIPGERWGLDDGSPGFKGEVIKNTSLDEIKIFAAAFLSGVSQGFQETESTILGTRTRRSVQTAALEGSSAVLDEYARTIAEAIKRDGVYVRVPGGTTFYLLIPTTLNRSAARIGATLQKTP